METKYEDWRNPVSGVDPEERRNSSLNFKQLLGTVDTCVEKLYEEGASEKEIRKRVNKQITETVNSTDKLVSEDVLKAVSRIKQEGDHHDEEDYDELIELLQQTLTKIKK